MPKKRRTNPNYNKLKKLWLKYKIQKGNGDVKESLNTAKKIVTLQEKMKKSGEAKGFVAKFPDFMGGKK